MKHLMVFITFFSLNASAEVFPPGPLGTFMMSYKCHGFLDELKDGVKGVFGSRVDGCVQLCQRELQILKSKLGLYCGPGRITSINTSKKCESFLEAREVHSLFSDCVKNDTVKENELVVDAATLQKMDATKTITTQSTTTDYSKGRNCIINVLKNGKQPDSTEKPILEQTTSEFICLQRAFSKCLTPGDSVVYNYTEKNGTNMQLTLSCKEKQCCYGVPGTVRARDAAHYDKVRKESLDIATSSVQCVDSSNCEQLCRKSPNSKKSSYWIANSNPNPGQVKSCVATAAGAAGVK